MRYPDAGPILINSYPLPANCANPRLLSEVHGVWVDGRDAIDDGYSPAAAWGLRRISHSFHAFHLLVLEG